MRLSPGERIGHYEILSTLGTGGMGEVYRARDHRLHRDVAVKVLSSDFVADPERLARFRREARILASVNHPNVGGIFGLEESSGVQALILELVEGPTLAAQIAAGPVPLHDALLIARQIAEALEAAHELGIVHRDLKPGNIKVRPDGAVKVLDFGLARSSEPIDDPSPQAATRPSLSSVERTQSGIVLGTAGYMSPEQAAGRRADRASDLWALGVVLLEMLTGRPAFTGESLAHVLAAVLTTEPDLKALPADTPRPVIQLLRRCLQKDPRRRLDSARAARLEIEEVLSQPASSVAAAAPLPRRGWMPLAVAAAVLGSGLAALVTWLVTRPEASPPRPVSRFAIALPPEAGMRLGPFDRSVAVSPDGRTFVYISAGAGSGGTPYVRRLDELGASALAASSRARGPFFSPDGEWIGFFEDTSLKRAAIAGGPAVTICPFIGAPRGASWGTDGAIVFATSDQSTGLWRVAAGGGEPAVLTTPDAERGEGDHVFPALLPDNRGVLFTIVSPGRVDAAEIAVLDAHTNERRTLIRGGSQPQYLGTGHLLYLSGGSLHAVGFDLSTLQVRGDPVPVVDRVRMLPTGAADLSLSPSGTMVYVPGGPASQPLRSLVWVDRQGREAPIEAPARAYAMARLSPDGAEAALDIRDQENDIWILPLARPGSLRKLTHGQSLDTNPVWTRDGRQVIFTSNRSGPPRLYRQPADGSGAADPLSTDRYAQFATSVTADGAGIVGYREGTGGTFDIVLFPLPSPARPSAAGEPADTPGAAPRELVHTPSIEFNAEISPDGRYLAYQSNESGRFEVMLRPFPEVGRGMWTISTDGGTRPVWSRSGKELFYRDEGGGVVAVPVDTTGSTPTWAVPRRLFEWSERGTVTDRHYDVSPDAQRFLMFREAEARTGDLVVVVDWLDELKRLVPTR